MFDQCSGEIPPLQIIRCLCADRSRIVQVGILALQGEPTPKKWTGKPRNTHRMSQVRSSSLIIRPRHSGPCTECGTQGDASPMYVIRKRTSRMDLVADRLVSVSSDKEKDVHDAKHQKRDEASQWKPKSVNMQMPTQGEVEQKRTRSGGGEG